MEKFRSRLNYISENLSDDDLLHMKNLSRDFISRSEIQSIKSGIDLFELLETKNKLTNTYVWLLADMLRVIDQNCLLEHLELGEKTDQEFKDGRWQISMYRLCLTKLAMEVGEEEFKSLKRECNCTKEDITDFYRLITYLETRKKISSTNIDVLCRAFKKTVTDLMHQKKINSILWSFQDQLSKEGIYRMTSKPRGICVIINNERFDNAARTREGTNIDADSLTQIFEQLMFVVERYDNLRADKITSVLAEVSGRDHWLYDCFVCCVLSHGSPGSVDGVDDYAVKINTLLQMFFIASCPSLDGKPKLFFLQACQGNQCDGSSRLTDCPVKSDVREEEGEEEEEKKEEEAAPSVSDLEPDFLLGYATPLGYKSFRSASKGSWYIQSLVKNLKTLAASEKLLDILVKVNSDVAEMSGVEDSLSVKQTPCPIFTLRKTLYLADYVPLNP